jgi:hypothetical protein
MRPIRQSVSDEREESTCVSEHAPESDSQGNHRRVLAAARSFCCSTTQNQLFGPCPISVLSCTLASSSPT